MIDRFTAFFAVVTGGIFWGFGAGLIAGFAQDLLRALRGKR